MNKRFLVCLLVLVLSAFSSAVFAQQTTGKAVIAYFSGGPELLDGYDANQMTHIIFCFGHLNGNNYHIGKRDSAVIKKMVAMKQKNPMLKVLLSLGGWGGCKYCSDVFNTAEGREDFVRYFDKLNSYFGTDGIDLDWEYPAVNGIPATPSGQRTGTILRR